MEHSIKHVSAATRSRPACLPSAAASENYISGSKIVFCPNGIRCFPLQTASVEQARKSAACLFDDVKSGVFNYASNCKSTRKDNILTGHYTPIEHIPVNLPRSVPCRHRRTVQLQIRSFLHLASKQTAFTSRLYHSRHFQHRRLGETNSLSGYCETQKYPPVPVGIQTRYIQPVK
jgi:hypothetical protein